jgi:DNA-binding CsgD family transcriptional regulator
LAEEVPEVAVAEAGAALVAFERLQAASHADAARALLRSLGVPTRAGPGGAGTLTGREVEVLRLVAAGLSNQEIATALVISGHTVRRHLQNIFAKIGVPSRAAATAYAFQHDLISPTSPSASPAVSPTSSAKWGCTSSSGHGGPGATPRHRARRRSADRARRSGSTSIPGTWPWCDLGNAGQRSVQSSVDNCCRDPGGHLRPPTVGPLEQRGRAVAVPSAWSTAHRATPELDDSVSLITPDACWSALTGRQVSGSSGVDHPQGKK